MRRRFRALMGGDFDYSPWHRALELAGILAFAAFAWVLGGSVIASARLPQHAAHVWWILTLAPLVAYVAADFVSGFVHFLADNFGSPETPLVGAGFIQPFREHHVDPMGITRHDFVEVNGSSALVSLTILAPVAIWLPASAGPGALATGVFVLAFVLAIMATNQIHQWAHVERPPALVAWLQRWRVILSPAAHGVHHTRPFNRHYCITAGWLNPLFERIGFFDALERALRRFAAFAPTATRE